MGVTAHKTLYCMAYPNTVPWKLGAANDISIIFVTQYPIFTVEAANHNATHIPGFETWQVVVVAPSGCSFTTENKYSEACSGFRRWGGRESYDQMPESTKNPLRCSVRTSRSVLIEAPTVIYNETRWSFMLNVTAARNLDDIAFQDSWRVTVLENGQIMHLGESPSPLLEKYYEAEWFWVSEEDKLKGGADLPTTLSGG